MRIWSLAALLLFGCPDGGDDGADTGVTDLGFLEDGCYVDNPRPDTGINFPPCAPATGGGCEWAPGRSCVWSYQQDDGACRCLGDAPRAVGEACNAALQDCAAGTICIDIGGEFGAVCHPVCTQANPVECDRHSTPDNIFVCFALVRENGTRTEDHGLCLAAGRRCNPLDDQCAPTETCVLLSERESACRPSGPIPIGGDCETEECAKGGVCVPLVDQMGNPLSTMCYEPCDLVAMTCDLGGSCTDVGIEGFGLCI